MIKQNCCKIIWLTGNSGTGKTTIGRILSKNLNGILLDGDEMRWAISETAGFSKKDREEHNLRVARLAKVLHSQGFNVIAAVIAPFEDTRNKIDKIIEPIWIYIKRDQKKDEKKPYEIPKNPHLTIDTDNLTIEESVKKICEYLYENTNICIVNR